MTCSDNDLIRRGDAIARATQWRRGMRGEETIEDSLRALPAVQVAVTPLEFVYGKAESIIGNYLIDSGWKDKVGGDRWWAWAGPTDTDNDRDPFYVWQHGALVADEKAAKAAAQADYEARVRSALTAQPSPEQVTAYSGNDVASLVVAVEAALACGMIPKSSAADGGASKYSEQVRVADFLRAALARVKGGA